MRRFEDALALSGVTLLSMWQYERLDPTNIALLYIFPVILTAIKRGGVHALFISLFSIVLFNFLFVPPRFSLTVAQPHYLLTFTIIVVVGQLVAYLANEAKKAKEIETSEITKDAILSSLSHELRTPLSAVMGASSTLLDKTINLQNEQKYELIESIHDGSIKIQNLMQNLLNMARLENGKLKPNLSEIDPMELLGTIIGKLDYEVAKKISLENSRYKNIMCDGMLIELALENIVENSLKYGTNTSIKIKEIAKFTIFEVSNDTELLETDNIEVIFTKFGRLKNSNSKAGVGLGLSICKAIAEIHNGKIEANVKSGRFTVNLYIPYK